MQDEIADWRRSGIDVVLSLLEKTEEQEMNLEKEAETAQAQGIEFSSLPIPDRQTPNSEAQVTATLDRMTQALKSGKNVLVHCRQGIGRSGLIAACLLIRKGMSPGAALEKVTAARGLEVPETKEQREWIDLYAPAFAK
ncbi:MAG TPA: dual specificity protein phosphatase family protein [Candidatus Sulfotelmatobacter sp.]|nr:dual specificity protein phosphatase family protein [Candidatus Sulfotelmatobacter sp.]